VSKNEHLLNLFRIYCRNKCRCVYYKCTLCASLWISDCFICIASGNAELLHSYGLLLIAIKPTEAVSEVLYTRAKLLPFPDRLDYRSFCN
jgi:hypothetical protein